MTGIGQRSAVLAEHRLLAILRRPTEEAVWLAELLAAAGVRSFEVPITEPDAAATVAALRESLRDVTLGIGTVTDPAEVGAARELGAAYVVTAVTIDGVVDRAHSAGLACIVGAATPTEILSAWRQGADQVKVFPARELGGSRYIAAVRGPLPQIDLVASGGIAPDDVAAYLDAGAAAVTLGGGVATAAELERRDADAVMSRLRALPGG